MQCPIQQASSEAAGEEIGNANFLLSPQAQPEYCCLCHGYCFPVPESWFPRCLLEGLGGQLPYAGELILHGTTWTKERPELHYSSLFFLQGGLLKHAVVSGSLSKDTWRDQAQSLDITLHNLT